ncbi:MAG: tetratricopeptide repeat protein [Acidobacteria bacterium]|nr:tetratricopeptide repeat protein [Acidobacteriota bacterium]
MAARQHHIRSFLDFELDLSRGSLLRESDEVKLRPKSFDVLCYLVENQGRLVTKQELIENLWPDTFVTDDSLVQCLMEVRRALQDDSHSFIKTVPRRGYLFTPEVRETGESDIAPARETEVVAHSLPASLTPLIGRESERVSIGELLARDQIRLVVLTGPSGTGKTRLALQVAADLVSRFDGGVWFVPLAAVVDPERLPSAIAQSLGLKESGTRPMVEVLKERLRAKRTLLVLDNFEQIVEAGPLVTDILAACPEVEVLVTSRATLHLSGEHDFPLLPLPLPDMLGPASPENISASPAVTLFMERARAARPDFVLTPDNARAVAEICARLDGLPLAIELAAARIRVLSPEVMRTRLENRLELLTGGPRDFPERQQTMRGAIAWSYDLLGEDERLLFRRSSVFVGGCTLEALGAVCSGSGDREGELLDRLTVLVEESLMRREDDAGGEPRFMSLETIREFARECLRTSGEMETIQRRHTRFFLRLAETAEAELIGADQGHWLDRLEAEQENLRAASECALETGDLDTALRLDGALWRFWWIRGYPTAGRARLTRLLALAGGEVRTKPFMKVLYAAGVLADAQGDYAEAHRLFDENLTISRELVDLAGVANSLNNLGIIAVRENDHDRARSLYEESLSIWERLGDPRPIALSLANLGNLAVARGDGDTARSLYEQSLDRFAEMNDDRGVASALNRLAGLARERHDYEGARALYQESLRRLMSAGAKADVAGAFRDLGDLVRLQGDFSAARRFYEESMVICGDLGDIRGITSLLERFALLALSRDDANRASRLARAAADLRRRYDLPVPAAEQSELERHLGSLGDGDGDDTIAPATVIGSIEEAIEYALVDSDPVGNGWSSPGKDQ